MKTGIRFLRSMSVLTGIFLLSGPAFSAQLSQTDGGMWTQSGGSFSSVSNSPGGSAVYASNNSTIIGNGLAIIDDGFFNYAPVYATSGATITLGNNSTPSTVSGTQGLYAGGNNSSVTMTGGTITSTQWAVYAYNAGQITLNSVGITGNGAGVATVFAWTNDATVRVNDSSIIATGTALGVATQSGGNIYADGVSVSSPAHAVNNSQGYVEIKNFSLTATGSGYGVNANNDSTTHLENGTITTNGNFAYGIWAVSGTYATSGTTVTGDGLTIKTFGSNSHGVLASVGEPTATHPVTVTLTNTNVETAVAYGLYADKRGTISLSGGSVTTTGNGAAAIMTSVPGSSVTLDGVDVKTFGGAATFGLRANNAAILMRNGTIETSGVDGYAVTATYGATSSDVTLSNVSATTTGTNGRLLHFIGNADQTNTVDVTDGIFQATDALAISARGANDTLTLTDATVSGNGTLLDVAEGGQSPNPALFTMTANHTQLTGGARVDTVSRSSVTLENGTFWTLTAAADGSTESTVTNLEVYSSTVAFAAPAASTFQTLTVGAGDPAGTAQYVAANGAMLHMNTLLDAGGALPGQQSDRLLINGDVSGTTQIIVTPVASSSGGLTTGTGIVLVEVVGGNAANNAFTLGNSPLIAGDYEYELVPVTQGSDKLFALQSKPRAGGGGSATAIPALPAPLLLMLALLILPAGVVALRRQGFPV